jgi:hypothetical protein
MANKREEYPEEKNQGIPKVDGGENKKISGRVKYVRFIIAILSLALFVFMVIQTFFAGMAVFGELKYWAYHKTYVGYFHWMVAGMFLLSFFGRLKWVLRWSILGLWIIISLQYITAHSFANFWLLAGLHPVNALFLFWGSIYLMKRSWKWLRLRDDQNLD